VIVQSEADYKAKHADLSTKYGGSYKIPPSELFHLQECLRAMYVLDIARRQGSPNLAKALREHDVMPSVIEEVTGITPVIDRRVRRADKQRGLEQWCLDRPGQIFKVDEIAEGGQVSSAKVRTFIECRPDLFSKAGRGRYQIRNAQAERSAAKNKDHHESN